MATATEMPETYKRAADALRKLSAEEIVEKLLVEADVDVVALDRVLGVSFRKRCCNSTFNPKRASARDLYFPDMVIKIMSYIKTKRPDIDLSGFPLEYKIDSATRPRVNAGDSNLTGDAAYAAKLLSILKSVQE